MAVPWPFLPFVLPLVLPASRSLPTFFSLATFDLSVDFREDFVGRFLVTLGMGAYLPCHGSPRKGFLARIRPFAPLARAPVPRPARDRPETGFQEPRRRRAARPGADQGPVRPWP